MHLFALRCASRAKSAESVARSRGLCALVTTGIDGAAWSSHRAHVPTKTRVCEVFLRGFWFGIQDNKRLLSLVGLQAKARQEFH
jgi:hypothetical protein